MGDQNAPRAPPTENAALFSTVGSQVAGLEGDDVDTKLVDEIESLCMNCEKNVGPPFAPLHQVLTIPGNYENATHQNSLLPRDHSHVLPM
jgi:hypothetical protein